MHTSSSPARVRRSASHRLLCSILILILILLVPPGCGGYSGPKPDPTIPEVTFDRYADSVVKVTVEDRVGAGAVVSHDGLIATAEHVVGSADTVHIQFRFGPEHYEAVVIARNPAVDLVLIRIIDTLPPRVGPIPIRASETVREGEIISHIGHPGGTDWTISTGVVSAIHRDFPVNLQGLILRIPVFQMAGPIVLDGSSGGPILDGNGELIGIALFTRKPPRMAMAFALCSRELLKLLDVYEETNRESPKYMAPDLPPTALPHQPGSAFTR